MLNGAFWKEDNVSKSPTRTLSLQFLFTFPRKHKKRGQSHDFDTSVSYFLKTLMCQNSRMQKNSNFNTQRNGYEILILIDKRSTYLMKYINKPLTRGTDVSRSEASQHISDKGEGNWKASVSL